MFSQDPNCIINTEDVGDDDDDDDDDDDEVMAAMMMVVIIITIMMMMIVHKVMLMMKVRSYNYVSDHGDDHIMICCHCLTFFVKSRFLSQFSLCS